MIGMMKKQKTIGWLVLVSFVMFLYASAAPLRAEETTAPGTTVSAADDDVQPGLVEKSSPAKVAKKGKFPWLLVAAGVVVAGAVVYFTLIYKPKYALTVTVGEGVTGTPVAGSVEYKKGTVVNYNFSAAAGYKKLVVTLDGAAVAASGTVTMDKVHTLAASATEGVDEQFTSGASNLWQPWHTAAWSVGSGYYKCNSTAVVLGWEYNLYNYRMSTNQFVTEVRQRRTGGATSVANGIGLFTSSNMANASGYVFVYSASGSYWILKYTNYNFQTFSGTLDWLVSSTASGAIHTGLNQWNTIRITRSGSNYTLAINGTNVDTFSDNSHDVRYISLQPGCFGAPNSWDFDYVIVTKGPTLAAPAFPARIPVLQPADLHESLTGKKQQ